MRFLLAHSCSGKLRKRPKAERRERTGEGPLVMENDYSDIINLEHPTSKRHPRMSMMQRAAQFAPFAALTGHSEAIDETARKNEDNIAQQDAYVDE